MIFVYYIVYHLVCYTNFIFKTTKPSYIFVHGGLDLDWLKSIKSRFWIIFIKIL